MIYAKTVGIVSEIHFIPMKINYLDILDVLEIAEIGQINQVSILKFVPQGRGLANKTQLKLSNLELTEFMDILSNQKKYNGKIRVGIPLAENNNHLCTAGMSKLSIRYDGAILPCPAFKELDYDKVKNIYDNLYEIEPKVGYRKVPLCKNIHNE